MTLVKGAFLLFHLLPIASALRVLQWPALNCTQQLLECKVNINNCLDPSWLKFQRFTPSDPVELEVSVDTRTDENGHLLPVILARWKARDDGSISYMKGTELNVLMTSTNHNLCVRYLFSNELPMRNAAMEKWAFFLDRVVVQPGLSYVVSVSHLPKPNLWHTHYNVNKEIVVPGCDDPRLQRTKPCLETGSLWEPNITLERSTSAGGRDLLGLGFNSDEHAEKYRVSLKCSSDRQWREMAKNNQTSLNVIFDLEKWQRTCCHFDAEIVPFFPLCMNDCARRRKTFNICSGPSEVATPPSERTYAVVTTVALLVCVTVICVAYILCRQRENNDPPGAVIKEGDGEVQRRRPPRVLVIYSQDHRLYRDVVLKLCAFLRAKCGTEVVLDLLDATWLGTLGPLPWLEWQWRRVKGSPGDKVLILCSPGVSAKWGAMCGLGRVTLREDVLSSVDDMLTPALRLLLTDMQLPASMGRYLVAYFDDVCGERDVPSVFDIAVKYKLMKHFEELFFRILDVEKYQPGQVSHVEGIGEDEYFSCPSGKALRCAIEAFQAYQLENPDWFEEECKASEEDVAADYNSLLIQQAPPVRECVPEWVEGRPVYVCDVHANQESVGVYTLIPEVNEEYDVTSVLVHPRLDSECQFFPLEPAVLPVPGVMTSDLWPCSYGQLSVAAPDVSEPVAPTANWLRLEKRSATGQCPMEDEEEESLASTVRPPSPEALRKLAAFQLSLCADPASLSESLEDEYLAPPPTPNASLAPPSPNASLPVETDEGEFVAEDELAQASGKRPVSGSDQGYISRTSSQLDTPDGQNCGDPLFALARLQEELFENSLRDEGLRTKMAKH